VIAFQLRQFGVDIAMSRMENLSYIQLEFCHQFFLMTPWRVDCPMKHRLEMVACISLHPRDSLRCQEASFYQRFPLIPTMMEGEERRPHFHSI
jgi:hypothetical protein